MKGKRRILLVCPGVWDEQALARPEIASGYEILRTGDELTDYPSLLAGLTFDVNRFIRREAARWRTMGLDGVVGTGDYPGCLLAAALAGELGLPSPRLELVTRLSHKLHSRDLQRALVPEATPAYEAFDPLARRPGPRGFAFPFFVKPVKGTMSIRARLVRNRDELAATLRFPLRERLAKRLLLRPFDQLLRMFDGHVPAHWFLAETPLAGEQVTVDGFVQGGRATIMGVVDSVFYPGTRSFSRFDYPSRLPDEAKRRMREVCIRLMEGSGFDDACFNVELMWDRETGALHVIEVNPRMSYQFADLYERVDGTNTYEVQLQLACGETVAWRPRAGRDVAATSYVLRRFRDARVRGVPAPESLRAIEERHPGVRVKVLCKPGERLSDHDQDPESFRYGIVNLSAESEALLEARWADVRASLSFDLDEV